jgi:membrane-bound inhibitor of C-type lysozyme
MSNRMRWVAVLGVLLVALGCLAFLSLTPKTAAPTAEATYACDGGNTLDATFFKGETKPPTSPGAPPTPGGRVDVKLSDGREMTLRQTISADGGRYANGDESFVFWDKGTRALVLENGKKVPYVGCIKVAPQPAGSDLAQIYISSSKDFSIRLPNGYRIDEKYQYQGFGPGDGIDGVKFTIPADLAKGTNLSQDTYVSVEEIPDNYGCSGDLFLVWQGIHAGDSVVNDNGTTWYVASSTEAAAGNRYEETVYAIFKDVNAEESSTCIAVRYFIHYGAFENYPSGTVREFDMVGLLKEFDAIRRTLVVAQ